MAMVSEEHAETLAAALEGAAQTDGPSGVLVAGRYRVLELLGSGGMGTVYKVHDTELDEVVALKTLRREVIATPGALERFKREVKLARKVTHRSIARMFDVGETEGANGEKFLTMEYVAGRSLGRVLSERGPLSPSETVAIGTAIAEGLTAAHAVGVVHRDLKPDNILIEDGGRVVLTDFGVARAMEATDVRATGAGGIVGTPAYMAPEQVESTTIDARTDVYALGVVLFEMLSGELPFEGETALAIAAARLFRAPRELRALRPDLPSMLVDVVQRALSRSPSARFASAQAMGAALATSVTTTTLARRASVPPPAHVEERRIAVAPLRPGSPDDAWMAEGLAEDLGDALSMIHGVRVKARAGAPAPGEDLREYGRRNDVEALVEGTIRREGERFRATIRLVSAQDGFQVWAHRFEGTTGDLLRVSDEAAQAIAKALSGATVSAPSRPASSAEAVELYLRARQNSTTFLGLPVASEQLTRAAALAPQDPTILSALAIVTVLEIFRPGASPDLIARANGLAERALALAPQSPEPHLALARVRFAEGDDAGAMRAAMRAKQFGPSVGDVDDFIGRMLAERDLLPEAIAHLERALWIDPSLHFSRIDLARTNGLLGNWPRAGEILAELRARSPQHYALIGMRLALWSGNLEWLEDIVDLHNAAVRAFHRITYDSLRSGSLDEAAWAEVEKVIEGVPAVSRPARLFRQMDCELHCRFGYPEAAQIALERAVAAGLADLAWIRRCPVIAPLRLRPGFDALVRTVEERGQDARHAYTAGPTPTLSG